jgi:hypothetical protein
MTKPIAYSWTFASKSNPNKTHETLQYTDGSTSCQCMGWTRQIKPDGSRSCTHTRMVESGLADDVCVKKLDLTAGKAAPTPIKAKKAPAPVQKEEEIVVEAPKKAPNVARMIKW